MQISASLLGGWLGALVLVLGLTAMIPAATFWLIAVARPVVARRLGPTVDVAFARLGAIGAGVGCFVFGLGR